MFVSIDRQDGVAVLHIDRPPANAIDLGLLDELVSSLERAAADPPAALVLAGRSGFFSAGVDLKLVPGYGPEDHRVMVAGINRMVIAFVLRNHLIDAGECVGLGVFDEALDGAQVEARALEVAREMVAFPDAVYAQTKRALRGAELERMRAAADADPLLEAWVSRQP